MDKTRFSNNCKVLAQLWVLYKDNDQKDEGWEDFFRWADVGLPLAYAKDMGYITGIKPEGKDIIEETWGVFCELIAIDPNGEYDNIVEAFAASPNPALETNANA